jgi:hypothetical protein
MNVIKEGVVRCGVYIKKRQIKKQFSTTACLYISLYYFIIIVIRH